MNPHMSFPRYSHPCGFVKEITSISSFGVVDVLGGRDSVFDRPESITNATYGTTASPNPYVGLGQPFFSQENLTVWVGLEKDRPLLKILSVEDGALFGNPPNRMPACHVLYLDHALLNKEERARQSNVL